MINDPAGAPPSKGVSEPFNELIEDPYPGPGQATSSSMAPTSDAAGCDAGKAQAALGKSATQAVVDKVVADSGARSARVIKPGMAVTMDYREDRVNINVDAGNKITAIKCG